MARRTDPPGPKVNLPPAVIGHMMPKWFPFDPLTFSLTLAREFGDDAYYRVGPTRLYQLSHPNLARQILVEQPDKFHKARLIKRAFRPFAGNGLFTRSRGPRICWRSTQRSKPGCAMRSVGYCEAAHPPWLTWPICLTARWSYGKPFDSIRPRRGSCERRLRTSVSAGMTCRRAGWSPCPRMRCTVTRASFLTPSRSTPKGFAPGWEERIPHFAYLPFGGGPRVWIGNGFSMMEARPVLSTVAARYRLELEPNQSVAPFQMLTSVPGMGFGCGLWKC